MFSHTTSQPSRARRVRAALLALGAASALGASCRGDCRAPVTTPQPTRAVKRGLHHEHVQLIPASAEATVFFPTLARLSAMLRGGMAHAPPLVQPGVHSARWRALLALDPRDDQAWRARGLATTRPASLFRHEGRWALIVEVEDEARLRQWLGVSAPEDARLRGTSWVHRHQHDPTRADAALLLARRGKQLLLSGGPALFPGNPAVGDDAKAALRPWLTLTARTRWDAQPAHRKLRDQLRQHGSVFGVIAPGRWITQLPTSNMEARRLRDRMTVLSGHIGWAAQLDLATNRLRVRVISEEDREEPTTLGTLDTPRAPLASLDRLLHEDMLGVLRISASPADAEALIRQNLPAAQLARWDAWLEELHTQLDLDLRAALLDNVRGHLVAIVYELDTRGGADSEPWFLRATHEAIYVPVRDRLKLEYVLDAITQLTQQRLVRQRVRSSTTVQYAWLTDGAMDWALVLTDDAVIYVDSPIAFDRARAFLRGKRRKARMGDDPEQAMAASRRLLTHPEASGVYLNTARLREALEEGGMAPLSAWVPRVGEVLLQTRDQDRASTTEIELLLTPSAKPASKP